MAFVWSVIWDSVHHPQFSTFLSWERTNYLSHSSEANADIYSKLLWGSKVYCCGRAPGVNNMNIKDFSREITEACLNQLQENKSESLVTDRFFRSWTASYLQ